MCSKSAQHVIHCIIRCYTHLFYQMSAGQLYLSLIKVVVVVVEVVVGEQRSGVS